MAFDVAAEEPEVLGATILLLALVAVACVIKVGEISFELLVLLFCWTLVALDQGRLEDVLRTLIHMLAQLCVRLEITVAAPRAEPYEVATSLMFFLEVAVEIGSSLE